MNNQPLCSEHGITYQAYLKKLGDHIWMSNAQRAKIFAPYDALEGMYDQLRMKEHQGIPKTDLTEYSADVLNKKLCALKTGMTASITYYFADHSTQKPSGEYRKAKGKITRIDVNYRFIQVADLKICLDDIIDIEADGI